MADIVLPTPPSTDQDARSSRSFAYVDCDVPPEQTLAQWRRERQADRRAQRPALRPLRLTRRLLGRRAA